MDVESRDGPVEIAVVGDVTDHEMELTEKFLSAEPGGQCTMYIDSPGGSPYTALSLLSLIKLRDMRVTAVVTGECSSAMLWPFAACERRLVTSHSVFLFHSMKWQSEDHIDLTEAAEWARHFGTLEESMDALLADLFEVPLERIRGWIRAGRYVSGHELADAGLAELIGLEPLPCFSHNGAAKVRRRQPVHK